MLRLPGLWVPVGAVAAVGVLVLLLGPVAWWATPAKHLTGKDKADARNATRQVLLAAVGGLALLTGAGFSARTFYLARRGQYTDRYGKAIAQLASDKLTERLGGVYALEHLMAESARERPTVVQVLSAFVREQTRTLPRPDDAELASGTRPELSTDVQAALTVLGRRPDPEMHRLDLTAARLYGARLEGAQLAGARMTDVHLDGAMLNQANLRGAILAGASLRHVSLFGARMQDALLNQADLHNASLWDARLPRACVYDADLTKARLNGARLHEAVLAGSDLSGAILDGADLTDTDLTSTDSNPTNLSTATGLTAAQLVAALMDEHTLLPPAVQHSWLYTSTPEQPPAGTTPPPGSPTATS